MGVRDKEIERLTKYAEGLGLKVTYNRTKKENSADWVIDGTEIRIYTRNNFSKTDTILSLIHELGHHLWFIYQKERQPDLKFEEAIDRENLYAEKTHPKAPKNLRKKILDVERDGVKYWDIIVKDTNIKIPTWKINLQSEFDIYQYEVYYETGEFPKRKTRIEKLKELTLKHKRSN